MLKQIMQQDNNVWMHNKYHSYTNKQLFLTRIRLINSHSNNDNQQCIQEYQKRNSETLNQFFFFDFQIQKTRQVKNLFQDCLIDVQMYQIVIRKRVIMSN